MNIIMRYNYFCVAPLATNTIVLASLYKIYPEKVATAVLLFFNFLYLYTCCYGFNLLQDITPPVTPV